MQSNISIPFKAATDQDVQKRHIADTIRALHTTMNLYDEQKVLYQSVIDGLIQAYGEEKLLYDTLSNGGDLSAFQAKVTQKVTEANQLKKTMGKWFADLRYYMDENDKKIQNDTTLPYWLYQIDNRKLVHFKNITEKVLYTCDTCRTLPCKCRNNSLFSQSFSFLSSAVRTSFNTSDPSYTEYLQNWSFDGGMQSDTILRVYGTDGWQFQKALTTWGFTPMAWNNKFRTSVWTFSTEIRTQTGDWKTGGLDGETYFRITFNVDPTHSSSAFGSSFTYGSGRNISQLDPARSGTIQTDGTTHFIEWYSTAHGFFWRNETDVAALAQFSPYQKYVRASVTLSVEHDMANQTVIRVVDTTTQDELFSLKTTIVFPDFQTATTLPITFTVNRSEVYYRNTKVQYFATSTLPQASLTPVGDCAPIGAHTGKDTLRLVAPLLVGAGAGGILSPDQLSAIQPGVVSALQSITSTIEAANVTIAQPSVGSLVISSTDLIGSGNAATLTLAEHALLTAGLTQALHVVQPILAPSDVQVTIEGCTGIQMW